MSETHEFVVELKHGVAHSDSIKHDLDVWVADGEVSPGECLWRHSGSMSQECSKDTLHHNPDSFWSEQVRLKLTSVFDIQLTSGERRAVLGLVYCEKHVRKAKEQIASVKLCRRSVAEGSKQTFGSTSSNPPAPKFGSHDLKGFDFMATGASASLAPFEAGDGDDASTLDAVSDTRKLTIRNDGVKVHAGGSQSLDSTREGLEQATPSTKRNTFETPTKPTADFKPLYEAYATSLSPTQSPHAARRNSSVSGRSRPSTPTDPANLTPYVFEGSVTKNAQKVADVLMNWQGFTDKRTAGKEGWVYIVRDPKLDLVKIGYTQDCIDDRLQEIKSQCEATSHEWNIVEDLPPVPILAYKLLEKLVHADLAPHRWYFDCACGFKEGKKKVPWYTKHQEWFEITDEFALSTLQLWRNFLSQEPFELSKFGGKPQLEPKWHGRLLECLIPIAGAGEEHHSHDLRLKRWSGLLDDTALKSGQVAVKGEEVAVKGEEVAVKSEEVAVKREEVAIKGEEVAIKIEDMQADTVGTNVKYDRSDVERECNAIGIAVKREPDFKEEKPSKQVPSPLVVTKPTPSIAIVPSTPLFGIAGLASQNDPSKTSILGIEEPAPAVNHEALEHHTVLDEPSRPDSAKSTASVHPSGQFLSDHSILAPSTNATITAIEGRNMHLDIDLLFRDVTALLNTKKPSIPERTILEDLVSLRWPLSCLMAFALHGPYVPATLSVLMWTVFLPFFIAELRGWY
ncbi:hypothetical protein LTR56_015973 [Elasticomyces elasticus]|nr:hypothetical protein LTR22_021252 [Elasticomyces elasticus]KAK3633059.1 hypothetical protein LTR56_015973 [Elasticomyces elasticus]KAK4917949.1 hypothetical protein LTR49_014224 [Elasticomyces elasticus]KAK5753345.1 hypothetical protein LTS12_016588 [Elasticomyces elasticus]